MSQLQYSTKNATESSKFGTCCHGQVEHPVFIFDGENSSKKPPIDTMSLAYPQPVLPELDGTTEAP